MVSPSKTKYSRVAQQQKTTSPHKVKLVKGPRPLIHHRFYLDIQRHQLAKEIETTIKELGGQIEFFLNKEITHFITDRDDQQQQQQQPQQQKRTTESDGGPSSQQQQQLQQPGTPTTPQTPRTALSYAYQPHLQQYLNEASPSSPCVGGTPNPTPSASGLAPIKPSLPRSRADAMLQRVRQQQQQRTSSNNPTSSPCSPALSSHHNTFRAQHQDRPLGQQSPTLLAKSWGKPIWTTEKAIKYLKKVIETCRDGGRVPQQSPGVPASNNPSSEAVQRKAANVQHLRGAFVKIDSFQRQYRPAFQLFKRWPVLDFDSTKAASPFNSDHGGGEWPGKAAVKSVRTATGTTNQPRTNPTAQPPPAPTTNNTNAPANAGTHQQQRCGYCEICQIEYDVLANHLATEQHGLFVKNEANFASLDKLIGDKGVDLKTFLSENQTTVEEEVKAEEEQEESAKPDAQSEAKISEKDTVVECKQVEAEEEEEQKNSEKPGESVKEDKEEEEDLRIREEVEPARQESPKQVKTYSRKPKGKNRTICATADPDPHGSPPAKRTYAGRKQTRRAALLATQSAPAPAPASTSEAPVVDQPDDDDRLPPAGNKDDDADRPPEEPSQSQPDAVEAQMFGRRSAIYHHPHNTLNHHNHQKVKAAHQLQQQTILNCLKINSISDVPEPPADEMKVLGGNSEPINNQQQSKRGAAERMGLKGSSLKQPTTTTVVHHHPVEMLECEGLDPKNTKRISLGLRQNPKRANLNEDFTSLLDETLGPMRKPRVRRESAKRVNYSEPREDEIASQEEIMQSILEKSAKEASEQESKKRKTGSPKRPLNDVKIRGIQWRAPSPHARPPVKSPLLYKVIEDSKPKNRKSASHSKNAKDGGSPSKSKNGLIVKIRRVRQSELSLLNDEAENFMFPKNNDSSDEQTDEDRQTSSETGPGELSQELPSSELDHPNSSTAVRKQAGTPSGGRKRTSSGKLPPPDSPSKKAAKDSDQEAPPRSGGRRGVRGPAALLQDNAEYYKFPDPGSRLRFPEAPIQPSPTTVEDDEPSSTKTAARGKRCRAKMPPPPPPTMTSSQKHAHDLLLLGTVRSSPAGSPYQHQAQLLNCGKNIINYVKGKEDGMGVFRWSNFRKNCKEIEPYRFAFERVPSLEPWYETFQRQDGCSETVYEYFGNTVYRKLPYEMGTLPPLKQNCCILNYQLKPKTPETTIPVSSASSCSGSSTSSRSGLHKTTTTTTTTLANSTTASVDDKQPLALPLKKRKLLVDSDRPRKSPREHASTLAILSLLSHHQQQQHNRRRTISGSSSVPIVSTNLLPPPSPTPSAYSPKKAAIQAHQNSSQEADSALGDEIRSSYGSDPITEKEDLGTKKIKFDPPVIEDSFVNYKTMCQELDDFLSSGSLDEDEEESLFGLHKKTVPIGGGTKQPLRKNLADIVQTCDKEPPLSLKQVNRHESIVRKIVQYDRKTRPLSAVTVKSFDGGGWRSLSLMKKRINRTGWPNAKKRIVTRKQQQQQQKVKQEKQENGESGIGADGGDGSRKSSTEESQISGLTADTTMVKLEDLDEEDEDDEDEFEDTMTMLDDEEPNGEVVANSPALLTDDEEEKEDVETPKKPERRRTPVASKMEEIVTRSVSRLSNRILPSSRYVTKTTTTMTRVDYNVPPAASSMSSTTLVNEVLNVSNHSAAATGKVGSKSCQPAAPVTTAEDDDKECDSISSRSIFVSDDCDTTSSTLINMQCTEEPLGGSQRNSSATPQSVTAEDQDEPQSRPASRSRQNTTRHLTSYRGGAISPPTKQKLGNLQPVVYLQKLNCANLLPTRSSSRTPIKKTYKRSIFTSALVNSSGKPLKRKKKKKHKQLTNGVISPSPVVAPPLSSPSPTSSEELNSATSSLLDCEDPVTGSECDTPTPQVRKSIKDRPPTPGPIKYSPRKLRKPRGRWYRER